MDQLGSVDISICIIIHSGCKWFSDSALGVQKRHQLKGGGLHRYSDVSPYFFCTHMVHQFISVSLEFASHPLAPLLHSRAFCE